jgi:hypothetical protein
VPVAEVSGRAETNNARAAYDRARLQRDGGDPA